MTRDLCLKAKCLNGLFGLGTGLSEFFVLAHFLQNMLLAKVKGKNVIAAKRIQVVVMVLQSVHEDGRFSHG